MPAEHYPCVRCVFELSHWFLSYGGVSSAKAYPLALHDDYTIAATLLLLLLLLASHSTRHKPSNT
jgi:hypothetical protein